MILIITTGGTIAANHSYSSTRYTPNQSGETLLQHVYQAYPRLADYACEVHECMCIDSKDMRYDDITSIVDATFTHLSEDKFEQAVILCGTDNIESLVFALHLHQNIHALQKPVVVTGAMRAFSAPDTDALINIKDAILWSQQLKQEKKQRPGLGNLVYLAMHQQLLSPPQVYKHDTQALDAFAVKHPVGYVKDYAILTRYLLTPEFDTFYARNYSLFSWSAPISGAVKRYMAYIDAPVPDDITAQAWIIQGTGNGTYPQAWQDAIDEMLAKNKPVVRTSRCPGVVDYQAMDQTLASQGLSSDKTHVLLWLCLQHHVHRFEDIQMILNEYTRHENE